MDKQGLILRIVFEIFTLEMDGMLNKDKMRGKGCYDTLIKTTN